MILFGATAIFYRQPEVQIWKRLNNIFNNRDENIAEKLGTIGYMQELNRTRVGEFSINQACKIEILEKGNIPYISIEELMKDKEKISIENKRLQPFLNGIKLTMKRPDGVYRIYCEQKFIGIGVVNQELLKRDIIL